MPQIQLHAQYDKDRVLTGYEVWTWNGPDLAMVRTPYTIQEAEDNFGLVLDAGFIGTDNNPDSVTLVYDDDGVLQYVQAYVSSMVQDSFETAPLKNDFSDIQQSLLSSAKVDVETKTGKTISGAALSESGGGASLPPPNP